MSVPTCVPRRSALNFLENVVRSMLYVAVRQKTCASADQPNLSSRCGQSVGTPTKFERCPHKILLHNLLSIGLLVFKVAVNGASVKNTTAFTSESSGLVFTPLTSTYRNP